MSYYILDFILLVIALAAAALVAWICSETF